jgi:predicted Fe-S protein YdhL (DUF1289 family)
VKRGVEMARCCRHPTARWLCGLVGRCDVANTAELLRFLYNSADPAAVMMTALLGESMGRAETLRKAAALGDGRAMAEVARWSGAELPQIEEVLQEPVALHYLYRNFGRPDCGKRAAELGWKDAMHDYAEVGCKRGQREWFYWMGKAAAGGHVKAARAFIEMAQKRQQELTSGLARRAEVCYYVGSLLRGHMSENDLEAFGIRCDYHVSKSLLRLLQTFQRNQKGARDAVNAWLLTAHALNKDTVVLNRDMRQLIGKMVWVRRFDWNIKFY